MPTSESGEHRILQESVGRFAEKDLAPHLEDLNHYPIRPLPKSLLPALRELGLFELAGSGENGRADSAQLASALEALSEHAAAPAGVLFAHCLAAEIIAAAAGERSQGRARLPLEKDGGDILAYPIYAEPGDFETSLRFEEKGSKFVLEGTSEFVVNAPVATHLLVPAIEKGSKGRCALFVVDAKAKGVEIGAPLLTLGLRGCPSADVRFLGAAIPAEQAVPGACELARDVSRRFRGPAAAIGAGIVGSSLRTASNYAQERYQGGKNIIEHQQVRAMLAGMLGDYQASCDAAGRLCNGSLTEAHAATLFVRAKEGAARATCDGVQLLGGYGYMEDYGQERRMRDAKQAQYLLGRCDPLRQDLLAEWLSHEGMA